ncbi:MAG: hypothetical protein P1Q69_09880 [Candidatus Thorarchaeota archaeon]|nr:hypothetical protein [Candidatus Thorarchaeota archaeon]
MTSNLEKELEIQEKMELITDLIETLKSLEQTDLFVVTHKVKQNVKIVMDDKEYNYVLDGPQKVSVKIVG